MGLEAFDITMSIGSKSKAGVKKIDTPALCIGVDRGGEKKVLDFPHGMYYSVCRRQKRRTSVMRA